MTDPISNCLFCRILGGEIPAKKVYEDEHVFAFEDINPKAPTHVLIIPKKHFAGLKEAQADDAEVIGRCHLAAAEIARQRNIERGYRTVLNVGAGAGSYEPLDREVTPVEPSASMRARSGFQSMSDVLGKVPV